MVAVNITKHIKSCQSIPHGDEKCQHQVIKNMIIMSVI